MAGKERRMHVDMRQRQAFEKWLQAKLHRRKCICCESTRWAIGDVVVIHSDDVYDEIANSEPHLVELICQECALVLHFDTRRITDWEQQDNSSSALM
jgi:hypothetical protein